MKFKILTIVMHVIFLLALIATIGSFVCFAFCKRTTATVTSIDAYPEDTIVYLQYAAGNNTYERKQAYSGSKQIYVGDQRIIWYFSKNPEKTVMVRDFAAYYILTAIMGVGEIAFFAGRKHRNE